MSTVFTSDLHSVQRFRQGKVRDIYEDPQHPERAQQQALRCPQ